MEGGAEQTNWTGTYVVGAALTSPARPGVIADPVSPRYPDALTTRSMTAPARRLLAPPPCPPLSSRHPHHAHHPLHRHRRRPRAPHGRARPAGHPERIRAGTPLDTTFIAPRTDTVAILFEHEGDTLRAGYLVLETRAELVDGARRVVHVQRMLIEGEPEAIVSDSSHLHWGTLQPISAHTRGDTPQDFHFGPGSLRVTLLPREEWDSTASDSTVFEVALAEPPFYPVPDLLLRALPLRVGYRAVLPVATEDGEGEMRVAVTGEETARALDGAACPVLVVEMENEHYGGTFRISPVNRAIIRYDSEHSTLVRPAGCPR